MDYYDLVSTSIDYIERNLTRKITLADIAASVNLSVPHLYRVFPVYVGCNIGRYIRLRRLSQAAEVLKSKESIIDIALEYQFETQEGFIRSFKLIFGITPGEYRRHPAVIPFYNRANIKRQKGDIVMQPRLIVKQFTLIGLETEIDLNSDFSTSIESLTSALDERILEITAKVNPLHITNMWYMTIDELSLPNEPSTYFFAGIETVVDAPVPEGMVIKQLPQSLFAVFNEKQRGTVGGPNGYAYRSWLPDSGYILNEKIPGDLEVYSDMAHVGYDDECEIYIPVCIG